MFSGFAPDARRWTGKKEKCKPKDIDLLVARPMTIVTDDDSKVGVHMECNKLVNGCLQLARGHRHPDVEKPYPSGAADRAMDGLDETSRSQKSLLGYPTCSCIGPMFVQHTCM